MRSTKNKNQMFWKQGELIVIDEIELKRSITSMKYQLLGFYCELGIN